MNLERERKWSWCFKHQLFPLLDLLKKMMQKAWESAIITLSQYHWKAIREKRKKEEYRENVMSIVNVREYYKKYGMEEKIMEF